MERLLKMPEEHPTVLSEVCVSLPSKMPFLKDESALDTERRPEALKRTVYPNSATEFEAV